MIEMGKQYRTKSGEPMRILCVDAPGPEPVIAITDGGFYTLVKYDANGRHMGGAQNRADWDLVEVPAKKEKYLNIYRNGNIRVHDSIHSASTRAAPGLLYRLRLEWSEEEKPIITVIR